MSSFKNIKKTLDFWTVVHMYKLKKIDYKTFEILTRCPGAPGGPWGPGEPGSPWNASQNTFNYPGVRSQFIAQYKCCILRIAATI